MNHVEMWHFHINNGHISCRNSWIMCLYSVRHACIVSFDVFLEENNFLHTLVHFEGIFDHLDVRIGFFSCLQLFSSLKDLRFGCRIASIGHREGKLRPKYESCIKSENFSAHSVLLRFFSILTLKIAELGFSLVYNSVDLRNTFDLAVESPQTDIRIKSYGQNTNSAQSWKM